MLSATTGRGIACASTSLRRFFGTLPTPRVPSNLGGVWTTRHNTSPSRKRADVLTQVAVRRRTMATTTTTSPSNKPVAAAHELSGLKPLGAAQELSTNIVDNPCWGSPDACSLGDLLKQIKKSDAILYESPEYLALNKPADLRMDGQYEATVHKLLTYWYPPPSLQKLKNEMWDEDWLREISKYHKHSDHPDNELRPTHQLDYATSGVLLVARSRETAGHARKCFEERQTRKVYLALLHGHVQTSKDWPELDAAVVDQRLAAQEDRFRRSRGKRRPDTFQGYQPPSALYQQWQQYALNKPQKKKSKLSKEQWEHVWSTLDANGCDPPLNPKLGWGHVKKLKQIERFKRAAKVYNDFILGKQQQEEEEKNENDSSLPLFFRKLGEDNSTESFYIAAPLGEVDDDFSMRLPPSLSESVSPPLQIGSSELVYRPSLTKCVVLSRGKLQNKSVTKVRLLPQTGRRHQLRVHTSLVGHSIIGDQTYEPRDERDLCNRMCLHSQMLEIPLKNDASEPLVIEAPDPFVLDEYTIESTGGR
eukprot:scaffold1170_cov174-Amphora_coffeaeformis.AAC.23